MCNEWEWELDRLRREEEMYEDYLFEESVKQEEEERAAEQLLAIRIAAQVKEKNNE